MKKNLLLLAGTQDATQIAMSLSKHRKINVIASLAGITRTPSQLAVPTRSGGFGGVNGLRTFITQNKIDGIIDATHPFARQMSENAAEVAGLENVPLLRYERPSWKPQAGDKWHEVESLEAALAMLPSNRKFFAAIGRKEVEVLNQRKDLWFLMRMIEQPDPDVVLPDGKLLISRPSRNVDAEIDMLRYYQVDAVLCKNSGGKGAAAKLEAARVLSLPVYMIQRPNLPPAEIAINTKSVERWVHNRVL
ncbi:cobalt-precorrin-6A reductase [Flexibacterium corallicola]|uniref:cobalt-precorrin-6A reductase n=1 Tax=Flexibacterium corallicola TaxID=3037259 RepID=UPI00286F862E|nr:cobalt-precorrin-6A reductase [Pseudovibrio sp. M1P-2-3]